MTINSSRKMIMKGAIPLLLFLSCLSMGFSQKPLIFTQKFSDLLEENDLIYEKSVERWYRIQPFEKRYSQYDLVIRTFEQDLEMRHIIRIHPENEPPQVHAPLLLNHMATNQESEDIIVFRMGKNELDKYDADWGMYADFVPKKGLTEYKYARLISIYKKNGPMVHTLLLRDERFGGLEADGECKISFNNDRIEEN